MSIFDPEYRERREFDFEKNRFSDKQEKKLLQALNDGKETFADIIQCPNTSCGIPLRVELKGDHVRVCCSSCGWERILKKPKME